MSNIRIDRARVIETFKSYVKNYDDSDLKVILKIEHTYRVADLCEKIGASIGLTGADLDIAWLSGMLHDVGRFEQLRRYNTFNDGISVSHAHLGCEILFDQKLIREFIEDSSEDELLYRAIYHHSDYRVPELDKRTLMYCDILRDADKIDILKVNCDFPLEEIYNATRYEIEFGEITKEVMDAFCEEHTVLRSLKKTAVDNVLGHISLVFELVYPESLKLARAQGYLDKMLAFRSKNPETNRCMEVANEVMDRYIRSRI